MTLTTLFTGGGLADIGFHAAGFESVQGIELDGQICEVAKANGIAVTEGNILDFNFRRWQRTDALHASPPCTNASVANSKGGETALDIALAEKVAEAINYFKPSIFTMENVVNYRNFKSFQIILNALSKEGYFFDAQHVNFADLGVPQSRVRLIVRAIKGFLPAYPAKEPHNGWYEAIEDLIPTLPESEFAPWQDKYITDYSDIFLVDGQKEFNSDGPGIRQKTQPAFTIAASQKHRPMRAFIKERKIVKMNTEAFGRFQTLPTFYKHANEKIIGNGVPCLGMQKIAEGLKEFC